MKLSIRSIFFLSVHEILDLLLARPFRDKYIDWDEDYEDDLRLPFASGVRNLNVVAPVRNAPPDNLLNRANSVSVQAPAPNPIPRNNYAQVAVGPRRSNSARNLATYHQSRPNTDIPVPLAQANSQSRPSTPSLSRANSQDHLYYTYTSKARGTR